MLSSLLTHATMSFLTHTPAKPRAGLSISAHALLSSAAGGDSLLVPHPTGALSRKQLEAALAPRALPSAERETVEAGLRVKVLPPPQTPVRFHLRHIDLTMEPCTPDRFYRTLHTVMCASTRACLSDI